MIDNIPYVPISWGELIDKITILEIKSIRITSATAVAYVRFELDLLNEKASQLIISKPDLQKLKQDLILVNQALWEIEDKIRDKEVVADFGSEFIDLARSVYKTNDRRAAIKREINFLLKSKLMEEKSYSGLNRPQFSGGHLV